MISFLFHPGWSLIVDQWLISQCSYLKNDGGGIHQNWAIDVFYANLLHTLHHSTGLKIS